MESLFGRFVFMRKCKWFIFFRFQACALATPTLRNSRRKEVVVVVVVVVVVRVVVVVLVVAVNA